MADQLAPVQQFEYLPGMTLRVLWKGDEPWFVARDVGSALGLTNLRVTLGDLDPSEKGVSTVYTPGGNQRLSIISESGLYLLVLKSRKPEARAFQKWVTAEVLPSIRKTGEYVAPARGYNKRPMLGTAEGDLTDTEGQASRWADHPWTLPPETYLKVTTAPRSDGREVVAVGHFSWTEGE